MNEHMTYQATAGQTRLPVQENIHVPFLAFSPPARPEPPLPPLELTPEARALGYALPSQKQHLLPGVNARMLDWFWANMEKCYYLWAPGSHKRFSWVKTPWEWGMEQSVHRIAESTAPGLPVFGGEGVEIRRLPLASFYPFTNALRHVICEGVFNDAGELVDATIHEWEDSPAGLLHITATVVNTRCSRPPAFVIELLSNHPELKLVPNYATDHEDYEASQWPVFLPRLYELWKDHPDPTQSVRCNLEVGRDAEGRFVYLHENGPVKGETQLSGIAAAQRSTPAADAAGSVSAP